MDGLNIDHLQSMSTSGGPFSWLTSGKVDAVLDIKFPRDPSEGPTLNALLGELADTITSAAIDRIPGQRELAKPPLSAPSDEEVERVEEGKAETPKVVVDISGNLVRPRRYRYTEWLWTSYMLRTVSR